MVNEQKKIAGIALSCGHEPETDADKWNNPQDCFCEQCHMRCCRTCFETLHLSHKYHIDNFTDDEWEIHVKSIQGSTNDFTKYAPEPVQIVTASLTDEQLHDELTRRNTLTAEQVNAEVQRKTDDEARFQNKTVKSSETKKKRNVS